MSNLFDYSQTPGSNNSTPPDGAPEGMAPSTVNNTIRQVMANLAGAFKVYTAGGTADAQTVTMDPALAAYSDKVRIAFIPVAANTGACTLNVNGLGAKSIKLLDGTDPPAGAFDTDMVAIVQYDGTDFALINTALLPVTMGGTGSTTASGARTNLGLGTIATQNASSVDIDGGAIDGTTIGASSAAAGTFTSVTAGNITASGNQILLAGGASGSNQIVMSTDVGSASRSRIRYSGNQLFAIRDDTAGVDRLTIGTSGVFDFSATPTVATVPVATNSTSSTHTVQQIELGHASDTTITRSAAGLIAVEGVIVALNDASRTHTCLQLQLGHDSDTTITRPAAGRAQIEGREVVTAAADATVLTSTIAELNKNDNSAAAITGYVSGMRTYLHEDGANSTSFDADANITENTFESIGPTGSGATNIWTAMDDIPSGARIAILLVDIQTDGNQLEAYARATGSLAAAGSATTIAFLRANSAAPILKVEAMVPLDASRRFDFTWTVSGETSTLVVNLHLRGFIL